MKQIASVRFLTDARFHPPTAYVGVPRKVDEFTSEIEVNGVRRKVSPWSLRDGQYIEGLDSIFLVQGNKRRG